MNLTFPPEAQRAPVLLILLGLITRVIFGEEPRSRGKYSNKSRMPYLDSEVVSLRFTNRLNKLGLRLP